MNKRILSSLIVLMGLAILGIISVQLIWMSNAITVSNQLFSQNVSAALKATTEKLEDSHTLKLADQFLWTNDTLFVNGTGNLQLFDLKKGAVSKKEFIAKNNIQKNTKKKHSGIFVVSGSTDSKKQKRTFTVDIDSIMSNEVIQELNVTATSKSNRINSYPSASKKNKSFVYVNTLPTDTIKITGDSVLVDFRSLSNRVQLKADIIEEKTQQFAEEVINIEIKRSVDPKKVSSVLSKELAERGIDIAFNFGIIENDSIQFADSTIVDSTLLMHTPFKARLYPGDLIPKSTRLAIFFPSQRSFILKSISWLLAASLLLSLIILITFSFSVFLILRQKKIADMKSDFINNMTHEFKTPIATITVAADSLINEKVIGEPEKIRYFTGMIRKENSRMNQQVENILRIARLEKKDFEMHFESVNIHELLDKIILGFDLQIKQRNGVLHKNFDAAIPIITTDINHCTNAINNLLDNANKYSPEKPEITISTKDSPTGVFITIKDNGIGMSKSVQHKIFDRFYRETSGNIHNVKGFGLGLSYVKLIAETNKGEVSVKSEPGKGSAFTLFLPFTVETY